MACPFQLVSALVKWLDLGFPKRPGQSHSHGRKLTVRQRKLLQYHRRYAFGQARYRHPVSRAVPNMASLPRVRSQRGLILPIVHGGKKDKGVHDTEIFDEVASMVFSRKCKINA